MKRIRATKFPKKYDLFWVDTKKFKKWPNDKKYKRPFLIFINVMRDKYRVVPVTTKLPYKNLNKYKNDKRYLFIEKSSLDFMTRNGCIKANNEDSVAVIKDISFIRITLFDSYHGTLNDNQQHEFDKKVNKGKNK